MLFSRVSQSWGEFLLHMLYWLRLRFFFLAYWSFDLFFVSRLHVLLAHVLFFVSRRECYLKRLIKRLIDGFFLFGGCEHCLKGLAGGLFFVNRRECIDSFFLTCGCERCLKG